MNLLKTKINFLILILFLTYSCSQPKRIDYSTDNIKIQKYLDSIRTIYRGIGWVDNYNFSLFVPDTIVKRRLIPVFGKNIQMLESPINNSRIIKTLEIGDTVYTPHFYNGKITSILSYNARLCDLCFETYDFCIAKDGKYGFIHSDNFVKITKKIPNSDYVFTGNFINSAIIDKNYSKIIFLNTSFANYSEDGEYLVYTKKSGDAINPSIYVYNISNNKETEIGKGHNPIFINKNIYYSFMPDSDSNKESILCYNMLSKKENLVIELPDSLTLYYSTQDGGGISEMKVKQKNKETFLNLLLSNKKFEIETSSKSYLLKLNGELIEE